MFHAWPDSTGGRFDAFHTPTPSPTTSASGPAPPYGAMRPGVKGNFGPGDILAGRILISDRGSFEGEEGKELPLDSGLQANPISDGGRPDDGYSTPEVRPLTTQVQFHNFQLRHQCRFHFRQTYSIRP